MIQKKKSNHKNHLANESSPYLLQHAENPVNWYPWNDEALELAKKEDKPILLSIGYAACHWCHVMAHESFEDPETARIMNQLYVCIKVDREERPDIDQIYMKFVQMTTGSGGWPLNVFLTPEQEPIYGGTYFPPDERYGHTSWKKVLHEVDNFYRLKKTELQQNIEIIRQEFRKSQAVNSHGELPDEHILSKAAYQLATLYDQNHGGFGQAPKFPPIYPLSLFLRYYHLSKNRDYLDMVRHSLKRMANGGIFDQIGGGFARYSVDEQWLVPHFEKMLYDNAQLVPLYLDTFLLSKDPLFLQTAHHTLEFVGREMFSAEGGFFSSLDADSEGVEGKYYIWDKKEITDVLGEEISSIFCDYYSVTDHGNFENQNILHVRTDLNACANRFELSSDELQSILREARRKLFQSREKRIRPTLDDKVLTSWNALMLSAYAKAFQISGEQNYGQVIEKNIQFIKSKLFLDGRLFRSYRNKQVRYVAYLDDYSFLIQGLLDAYEALYDESYLDWAYQLLKYTNMHFWDSVHFGYYYTSDEQDNLIERLKDEHDQSIPSATSVMLLNNLRFFSLTDDKNLLVPAEKILQKYASRLKNNAYGYASYALGLDFYLQKPKEIVLVGKTKQDLNPFIEMINKRFLPNKVLIALKDGRKPAILSNSLIKDKTTIDGRPTAYVCQDFSCSPPVTSVEALAKLLDQ